MNELQRQFRIALVILAVIIPVGIFGFMILENLEFLDAIWLTIITLTTIGYGDVSAQTDPGRIFTILLVLMGMSAILFTLQTFFALFASPALRELRQKRRVQKTISALEHHYIICGNGELVDKTVNYLRQRSAMRLQHIREKLYEPLDNLLDRLMGDDADGHYVRLRKILRNVYLYITSPLHRGQTILDVVVVLTKDTEYADHLRSAGLLVIEGDPTDEDDLRRAGVMKAQSMMVLLDNDTETLLTVLTAHKINAKLSITAAALEETLRQKMRHVGANIVITPYEVAGQFLNNATLRPAVNQYFDSLLFEQGRHQITEIEIRGGSQWKDKRLGELNLRRRFKAGALSIHLTDGTFEIAPNDDQILRSDETLLVVAPATKISAIKSDAYNNTKPEHHTKEFQAPVKNWTPIVGPNPYTRVEAIEAIKEMSQHFVICGEDRVARNAINKLDPERPFVIISNDPEWTNHLLKRGFRVIHGDATDEEILRQAGVDRAQAIMVSQDDKADSVMTVLSSRILSKHLLITATAHTDDMIDKLERAGADRVVSPFHVAAQFVLLATTRPEISEFMAYVLYNYHTGLETAELYMENESPWIGETIEALPLRIFRAHVIGIRMADRETYIYAPPGNYIIKPHEVLIVVTPMATSDELRATSYGSAHKRPTTLRRKVLESAVYSQDMIKEILEQRNQ